MEGKHCPPARKFASVIPLLIERGLKGTTPNKRDASGSAGWPSPHSTTPYCAGKGRKRANMPAKVQGVSKYPFGKIPGPDKPVAGHAKGTRRVRRVVAGGSHVLLDGAYL